MTTALNYQLLRLSGLLQLEQRARKANRRELEFLMVNDTSTVVPYQQAALWERVGSAGKLTAVSGAATPVDGAPYIAWLRKALAAIAQRRLAKEMHALIPSDLPERLAAEWPEWFPSHALWCPLLAPDGTLIAGMLLGRAERWQEGDLQVISALSGAYAQSLMLARFPRRIRSPAWSAGKGGRLALAAAVIVLAAGLIPIRQSVLAPAEIVPFAPALIRAPFEGVVDAIHVAPNATIQAGEKLVSLDTRQLLTRYDVASKALEMARTEYSEASQGALFDIKLKSQLLLLQSKIEQQEAEVAYLAGMLQRADVVAPADGVAVFDDIDEWIGKPVMLGERIMLVASPRDAELEIQVPVAEVATFAYGSNVLFFSNVDPDRAARAHLVFASYGSAATADGVLAYRFRARLEPDEPTLRLGLKGTAKIYGPPRLLALWVFRRPIAMVRQWLAF